MKRFFEKNKIFFISLSFLIIFSFFLFNDHKIPVEAGTYDISTQDGHNVSGFAWNSNIGWISFNSIDCDVDGDGTYEGASEDGGPAPNGCPTSGSVHNYGVYIDSVTGDISGFAWSENVGWISFNRNTSYCAGGDNIGKACSVAGDCPSSSCGGSSNGVTGDPQTTPYNTGSGAIAKYDSVNHTIDGWAKILSMGDDGWVSLNCTNDGDTCGTSDYGISADVIKEELVGWAWNGNDNDTGIGWISFDSDNVNSGGGDYQVKAISGIGMMLVMQMML